MALAMTLAMAMAAKTFLPAAAAAGKEEKLAEEGLALLSLSITPYFGGEETNCNFSICDQGERNREAKVQSNTCETDQWFKTNETPVCPRVHPNKPLKLFLTQGHKMC